jgi:hypothetical protein
MRIIPLLNKVSVTESLLFAIITLLSESWRDVVNQHVIFLISMKKDLQKFHGLLQNSIPNSLSGGVYSPTNS